jgi:hypothetical protein
VEEAEAGETLQEPPLEPVVGLVVLAAVIVVVVMGLVVILKYKEPQKATVSRVAVLAILGLVVWLNMVAVWAEIIQQAAVLSTVLVEEAALLRLEETGRHMLSEAVVAQQGLALAAMQEMEQAVITDVVMEVAEVRLAAGLPLAGMVAMAATLAGAGAQAHMLLVHMLEAQAVMEPEAR